MFLNHSSCSILPGVPLAIIPLDSQNTVLSPSSNGGVVQKSSIPVSFIEPFYSRSLVPAGLALGELRKENNFLRSLWLVTNPPSSQEHLLHPQLLQKPLRPFLAREYFDDVGV
ncbi:hypothetical protein GBA52_025048 [Prunus armeniaca]|nr:hypothetical protein GBA52_025048 [Prunus armeniaca]